MSKQDILPIKFDVESILASLDIRYETSNGKIAKIVKGVASLADASKDDLSFCSSNGEYGAYMISKSDAGVILCKKSVQAFIFKYGYNPYSPRKIARTNHRRQHLILVDNPVDRYFTYSYYFRKCKNWDKLLYWKLCCYWR